jgi:uncharacterized protein involved in exopolysaccharide biosynthesis
LFGREREAMPEEDTGVPGGPAEAPVPSEPQPERGNPRRAGEAQGRELLLKLMRPKTCPLRMLLLGMSLFVLIWLVVAHYVLPVRYTATTIFERRSDAASPAQTSDVPDSVQALRSTMEHDLKGFDAVAQAAEDCGLTRGLPHDEEGKLTPAGDARKQELVLSLMSRITMTMDVATNQVDRVSVSITDADPRLVQQLPDTLVRNYINRVSREIEWRLTESKKFLAKQVDDGKGRVRELTTRLIEFQIRHAGMLPDDPGAIVDTLQQIKADTDTLRQQRLEAGRNVTRLKEMLAARKVGEGLVQVVKGPNPERQRLKERLQEAKEELEEAKVRRYMTEKHPAVATLRRRITDLEDRVKETPEETVLHTVYGQDTPVPDDLDVLLASAASSVELTTNELERLWARESLYQNLLANFGAVRQEYLGLMADLAEQEAKRNAWETRLTEVEMALATEVAKRGTHLNAIQAAQPQYRPLSPKFWVVLLVALAGGVLAGIPCALVPIRFPPNGRLLLSLVVLAAMISAGLGAMSNVLRLEYPEEYAKWKAAPVSYLAGKVPH